MRDDRQGASAPSVLMTTDTMGGVWTYTIDLAAALVARGVRVALATMGAPPTAQQRRQARAVSANGVFETTYKLEWMDDAWDDVLRAGLWLLDLERLLQPDLVHLNGYCHAALPWHAPTVVVAHSCVLSWWEAVKKEPAPSRYDRYRDEVRRGLRAASLVVAPSRAMLEALERHYGPVPRGTVILNGRDPTRLVTATKEPLIFCATRLWDEAKNAAALAEAAEGLPWPVFVAGDTRRPSGGPEAELRLHHARILGRIDPTAVALWLARAAIFALPARYEPFGLSALEAAFSGCALVLGDIPSFRELWQDAAEYVQPDDVKGLREVLDELTGDPGRRQRLAERARARATSMTAAQMADRYLESYRQLVRARAERPAREDETPATVERLP